MSSPLSPPSFSVIIPTYRRPRQLHRCLEALSRMRYPRDRFEVIIVSDERENLPTHVVTAFRSQMSLTLLSQSHAGPASARNLGARHAQGDYLAFTDDDCAPASDWLTALATRFVAFPDHAVGGRTINALRRNACATASQMLISYLYNYYNTTSRGATFFASNNLAFPREAFHSVGGFDIIPSRASAEDRELCDRWLYYGYSMIYAPEARVYHFHDMSLLGYCRQHFTYGRGAFYFRRARAERGQGPVRLEPRNFYLDLVRYPFVQKEAEQPAPLLSGLLILSQVINAAGYLFERFLGTSAAQLEAAMKVRRRSPWESS